MSFISPATSSPSIYSRAAHFSPCITAQRLRAVSDVSDESEELSTIAGPKLRKFTTELPWIEDEWSRMRAFSRPELLPLDSDDSLSSTIVVEPRPASPTTPHRVKAKKSGLMRLFNKSTSSRPSLQREPSCHSSESATTTRVESMWSDTTATSTKPLLELRPVSMTLSCGLPYFCHSPTAKAPQRVCETDFQEQINNMREAWQVQLFELEAQVRKLRDELDEARLSGGCNVCLGSTRANKAMDCGVMDRGRAKTAVARGVFGSGSLYEWEY